MTTLARPLRTWWMVRNALLLGVVPFVIAGVLAVEGAAGAAAVLGGVAAVLAVLGVIWARVRWARWTWQAAPDALELAHGVLTRRTSLVPYHRIQQIDLQRGPVDQMLGITTLVLRTASATTDATLPGIDAGDAERLRHELLARAGHDDGV